MRISLILGLFSFPVCLSICSSPVLPHHRQNQMAATQTSSLRPPLSFPELPSGPATSFPLPIALTQQSCVDSATTAALASSLVWCPKVACMHSGDLGRAEGFSGSSCTHQLGVV